MSKVPTLKLKVKLSDLFEGDIPKSRAFREVVAGTVIDTIVSRTQSNEDVSGNKFKKYSKSYVESDAFKIAGKSKDNVNMTLLGDMLGTIQVTEQDDNTITFGWDDDTQNAKAYNHITGDTLPQRNFFGDKVKGGTFKLSELDAQVIREELQPVVDKFKEPANKKLTSRRINLIKKLLGE